MSTDNYRSASKLAFSNSKRATRRPRHNGDYLAVRARSWCTTPTISVKRRFVIFPEIRWPTAPSNTKQFNRRTSYLVPFTPDVGSHVTRSDVIVTKKSILLERHVWRYQQMDRILLCVQWHKNKSTKSRTSPADSNQVSIRNSRRRRNGSTIDFACRL